MITEALLIITFAASGANAPVDVYTDGNPAHWRTWPVQTVDNIDPGNKCRFRNDARRLLSGHILWSCNQVLRGVCFQSCSQKPHSRKAT